MRLTAALSAAIFATAIFAAPHQGLRKRVGSRFASAPANENTDDWSGVVVNESPDGTSFVTVIGTFTVPDAPEGDGTESAVSIWVGMDGYQQEPLDPVVQAGVDVILDADGDVTYQAWTEWTPGAPTIISENDVAFTSGDTVKVQVSVAAGATTAQAIFTVNDDNDERFTASFGGSAAARAQKVEWIVERLHGGPDAPPTGKLLNFGSILFTDCAASTATGAANTTPENGVLLDMLNADGGIAAISEYQTSGLIVEWVSA